MRFCILILAIVPSVLAVNSWAEDARQLLTATLAKYANPSAYYAEGTQETTITDDVQRSWQQERFVVARATQDRYHYDIKDADQWNIVVGDGSLEWGLQPWRNEYTRQAISTKTASDTTGPDETIRHFLARVAQSYIEDLLQFRVATAEFQTDETLTMGGNQVSCYVIRAIYEPGEHEPAPPKNPIQYTFWIEKDRRLVRKRVVVNRNGYSLLQPLREVERTYTTYYTRIELGETPPSVLFTFSPPTSASEVDRLFLSLQQVDLTGLPAPPLKKLRTLDGKPFDSTSLKGHPSLLISGHRGVCHACKKCEAWQSCRTNFADPT